MRSFKLGQFLQLGLCATALLVFPGCLSGFIYSDVTLPLDTNYSDTPVKPDEGESDVKTIDLRLVSIPVSVAWDSNAIGKIAKEYGFETVYYADLRQISVLGGLWKQDYVHVYGEKLGSE